MIEEYRFGFIVINGKNYNHDVEVRALKEEKIEILDWRRQEGHVIDAGDIKRAVEQNPETIVIGTGESGMAKITEEARQLVEKKGIKLITDITEHAVKTFNIISKESLEEEGKQERVIGLFHLTC